MDVEKNKKNAKQLLIGCFGFILIIVLLSIIFAACTADSDDEKANNGKTEQTTKTEKTKTEATKKDNKTENVNWKQKVKEVASSDGGTTEKFDAISLYANTYKPSKKEVAQFEKDIIKEYKDKKYIMDISNDQYMLTNIFKSQVVDQSYKDGEAIKDFAFDFWQNSKYNYRGVENMTSEATLSNEKQMDKALKKMRK